jgi:hypothetical protein
MDGLGLYSWQFAAIAACAVILTQAVVPRSAQPVLTALWRAGMAVVTLAAVVAVATMIDDAQKAAERRAIQARAGEIAARALAPGSPLACLDAEAGEAVETACEKAIFARPEAPAAALAYTEARWVLLADALTVAGDDRAFDTLIAGLRRSIELDRFGFASQVLATRDGCTAEKCAAFALVQEPVTLRANLKARAYEAYVARHAPGWNADDAAPATAEAGPKAATPDDSAQGASSPVSGRYDFPSAASIPPVSIMNAEPPRAQAEPGVHPAESETPLPPIRPATQGAAAR